MSVVPEVSLSLADATGWSEAGISVQGVLQGVSQDDLPDGESWAASDYERKKILSDTSFAELNDGRQFLRLRATYQGSDVKAYTVPVAYLRTAVNSGFSILGLPLQTSVLHQGVIASVSTNSFTDAAATWERVISPPRIRMVTQSPCGDRTILMLQGLVRSSRLRQ